MKIGGCARPLPGEDVCGDAWVSVSHGDVLLAALCDGLGHGDKAASASKLFCDFIEARPLVDITDLALDIMLEAADRALRGSRGVVAAIARFDRSKDELQICGVGNITMRYETESQLKPISLPGVIGMRFRKTKVYSYDLLEGDMVAMFSDGVSTRFEVSSYQTWAPDAAAEAIVREHGKDTDDASCIVIQYSKKTNSST